MRVVTIAMTGCLFLGMTGLALANPALLPNHPGYPSRGEFAYDTGKQNLTAAQSLRDAAESGNANIVQNLEDPANAKLLRQEGAGHLPSDPASNNKMPPSLAEKKQAPK
jgi:hypothetical protein